MTASVTSTPAQVLGEGEIRFERLLPGPIETVWEFLVDARKRGEWLAAGPLEPRVGGKVELRFKHSDLSPNKAPAPERFKEMDKTGHQATERVTRIEPPRLLAITWGETSEVTFELAPTGKDVLLTLTHRRIANLGERRDFAGGWHAHLDILVEKANGRVPEAFWPLWTRLDEAYEKNFPR